MKDLIGLQRSFQRHVHRPGRAMEHAVLATPAADVARRLGIYADACVSRLVGALRSDYPAMEAVLGASGFERMARAFILRNPSRHRNLRWFGGGLTSFLSRSKQWRRRPLLQELARFEWALGLAFDALDAPAVTAGEVALVAPADWPRLRLRLHPSVQLLKLRGNAPQVWRDATEGRKVPAARMRRRPVPWLVWRMGHEPFYRALSPAEAWALGATARGAEFAPLVSGLRRFVGTARAAQAGAQLVRNWLSEELICSIELHRP